MTMSDRAGLITRIRQVRRLAPVRDRPSGDVREPPPDRLQALEARVAHLEQLLEGLQDSVHRESERHAKLIAELESRVQPGVMGAALAEDARNRGL
jgi:hypothetical protein